MRMAVTLVPYLGLQATSITFSMANAIGGLVYPWLVFDLTGSAGWMGVVATVTLVPAIAGTAFGGSIAERVGIRRISLAGGLLGAVAALAIAWLHGADMLTIWLLVALSVMGAVLDGPAGVAIEARVPEIARLGRIPLARANAIDDLVDSAAAIAGPALGAMLVAVIGTGPALWVVAALNVLVVLAMATTLPRFRRRRSVPGVWPGFRAGLKGIASTPVLRVALTFASVGTGLFLAFQAVILPATLRMEGQSAALLGLFLATTSAGAIAANLGLALMGRVPTLRSVFASTFLGMAGAIALVAVSRSVPALAAAGALLGLAAGPLGPVFMTVLQTSVSKDLRAHVIGVASSLMLVGAPLATLVAGLLLDLVPVTALLMALSGIVALLALAALVVPGLRSAPSSP